MHEERLKREEREEQKGGGGQVHTERGKEGGRAGKIEKRKRRGEVTRTR